MGENPKRKPPPVRSEGKSSALRCWEQRCGPSIRWASRCPGPGGLCLLCLLDARKTDDSAEVRDPALEDHPKVQELRNLSKWSEGHVWSSPEMHGCITGAFKNQIDWLPLNTGSVRPTQA